MRKNKPHIDELVKTYSVQDENVRCMFVSTCTINAIQFNSIQFFFFFLVMDTQICKRLCPSVRRSVEVIELKNGKTSVLKAFCVCVCGKVGWVGRWV